MNMCLGASLGTGVFTALAAPLPTSDINVISNGLSANQYLEVLVALLILVVVFIVIAFFIGKKTAQRTKVNKVTKLLGMILAIIYLIVGTVLLLIDFVVLIEPYVRVTAFTFMVQTFRYYFPEMVIGIIIVGAAGLLLYLVGLYILVFVRDAVVIEKSDESYHIQASSELDADISQGRAKYTRIAYRVVTWDTNEPLSDGKVHLETREGTLMMIKYTDYTGEVDFGKLRGTEDDYYAYADGDRERQVYRFINIT